jgi:hypothetical protein
MQRITALWNQGLRGKIAVGGGAFLIAMLFCCAALMTAQDSRRPVATQPTLAPGAASELTARPAPTEAPAPTAVPPTEAPRATDMPVATEAPTAAPPPTVEPTPVGLVTKADYGEKWPFTVDSGLLRCIGPRQEIIFVANGETYALNGTAKSNPKYADIRPIWRDDPSIQGVKISVQPLIFAGLDLCK